MTEEIIIDKENKTKKHRNNEIDCLHFGCRKGGNGNVLFWCDFYDDYCDNYTGCYYRKYLRLEQERDELKKTVENQKLEYEELQCDLSEVENACGCYQSENAELKQENKELKKQIESDKGLITVGGKQQYEYLQRIDELEQENKALQAYKDINEDFKQAWYELNEKYKQLRSALEEINLILDELKQQYDYMTDYSEIKEIQNRINEVLQ